MSIDDALQLLLAVSSLAAIAMATSERPGLVKWAGVVGLAGQPLWLWSTWQAMQLGMFVVSLAYTAIWARAAWKARAA